jgi:hypothetical protein
MQSQNRLATDDRHEGRQLHVYLRSLVKTEVTKGES